MKFKNSLLHVSVYLFDLILLVVLGKFGFLKTHPFFLAFCILYILLKIAAHIFIFKVYIRKKLSTIRSILDSFRKGKYGLSTVEDRSISTDLSYLDSTISDLRAAGRYLENLVSSQNDEIKKFRELYDNIVLSSNSYFLVLNQKDEIIFANKSFLVCFRFTEEEITGTKFTDILYLPPGRFKDAFESVKVQGDSAVLRRIKLLSKKKISIIADLKVSRITVQGENQVILVMDDVTSQWRKDYQISLMSQISESIQQDSEVDKVLLAILTAVTSGSGLGFNRAMLLMHSEENNALIGKMAVGPDSLEEAGRIWSSPGDEGDIFGGVDNNSLEIINGNKFYQHVVDYSLPINGDNLFTEVFQNRQSVHIYDAANDERVGPEVLEFMDVPEFVIVPLCSSNKTLGIIVVDNKFNGAPIYEDHVELLSIFALQAALTIDSYNSLNAVQERMERIQARQDAIVESEKLAAVGRIAAHIAHEIRNPLVTVGGYARRILQLIEKNPKENEKVSKAAEIILYESERLEKILSNVMDFTRPSPLIREYNSLNDVVNDTYALLKNVFQEKKIRPTLELEEELPLVKSDFNQLKQVLLNLVQNAMDATPSGGEIVIKTSKDEDNLYINVKDTGEGIDPEKLDHIFDPFFTSKVTGVGLGLAVAKKIVNDHGGEIRASNNSGGGAFFSVELPSPS